MRIGHGRQPAGQVESELEEGRGNFWWKKSILSLGNFCMSLSPLSLLSTLLLPRLSTVMMQPGKESLKVYPPRVVGQ
jgi:hypothetical protein